MSYDILHTADFHVGKSKHILPSTYLERQKKMLYEILDIAVKNKVKIIFVAGDIFEKGIPSQDEKDAFIKWVADVDTKGIMLIILAGNHDEDRADKTSLDTLLPLQETKLKNCKVILHKPEVYWHENICFAIVPWQFEAKKAAKKLYKSLDKKPKKFVVLSHITLPGIPTDTGFLIPGSHKSLLKLKFVDAWLLGDIHKRFISKCGKIQMPGAPMQHQWGDSLPKGISLLKFKELNKPKLVELKSVSQFIVVKSVKKAKKLAKDGNIVKLVTNDVVEEDLDDNVVEIVNHLEEQDVVDYKSEFNVLEGLPKYMADKGLNEKQQKKAIELVEKLCR